VDWLHSRTRAVRRSSRVKTNGSIYKSTAGERAIQAFYEGVLAQWPVPHERLHVPTGLGDTFVVASGGVDAPPMLLLHGSSTNSASWMGDVPEYSRRYRAYAVDIPGEPGKSAQTRPSLKGEGYVRWLDDLLAALGVDEAVVVGVSLGGWIALQYAIARPERVSKLALLCPGGVTAPRALWMLRLIALSLLGEWGAEAIKRAIFRDVPISEEVEAFMQLVQAHYRPRIEAPPVFTDQELEEVRMPTLLVAGEKDMVYDSIKTAARMGKLLPQFQAALLPEAGHVLLDTPARVMPFLASV
jgi:pimeloyl-ACP methyl ester carboxylesterase